MRIAIVGAGKGGTNLIKTIHGVGDMEVAIVVDRSSTSPGILIAKEMGIATATELKEIQSYRVDAIIEATGVSAVAAELDDFFGQSKAIISSDVAKVIMTIVDNSVMVADQLGTQMQMIAKTSAVFQHEFGGLRDSIVALDQVSEVLLKAVKQSSQYIDQSDNLSKSVHAIASQTKILGINANIEAARAGEAGKGFSVVASEVQKLSDTSTKFATEISDLLKALAVEINEIQKRIDVLKTVSNTQTSTSTLVEGALLELNNIVK